MKRPLMKALDWEKSADLENQQVCWQEFLLHWVNAKSLFGWLSEIAAGQRISYKKEDYLTLPTAHFATRKMKQFSTSSLHACSLDNSGLTFCNPWV